MRTIDLELCQWLGDNFETVKEFLPENHNVQIDADNKAFLRISEDGVRYLDSLLNINDCILKFKEFQKILVMTREEVETYLLPKNTAHLMKNNTASVKITLVDSESDE